MSQEGGSDRGLLVAGLVCLTMALLIGGAQSGVIPAEEGAFFAPPPVITALWLGLLIAAAVLWLPRRSPAVLRGILVFLVICLVAVVCNWSAFAPGVRYLSTTSIGGFETTREDPVGGRVVFGLAALLVDAILLGIVVWGVRRILRRLPS